MDALAKRGEVVGNSVKRKIVKKKKKKMKRVLIFMPNGISVNKINLMIKA